MSLTEAHVLQTLMKWRTKVSAAAWLVVQDTHASEDIFQNIVLKAMTRDVTFESEGALLSWAMISARREGLDWVQHRRREFVTPDEQILDLMDRDWRSNAADVESRSEALRMCLDGVPKESRDLLRWRYFDGLSCDEVADRVGVQLGAIYKRLSRLHESLRQCVEGKLRPVELPAGGQS